MKTILIGMLIFGSFNALADNLSTASTTRYQDLLKKLKLSRTCKKTLTKNYGTGQNLSLDIIIKNTVPLSQYATTGIDHPDTSTGKVKINGYDFYHYTNQQVTGAALYPKMANREEAEKLIRQNNGYETIFKYLKKKELYGCCGADFPAGLYIAEDNFTSSDYGNWRLVLELSPETKVFRTTLAGDLLPPLSWDQVQNELAKKSEEVAAACDFEELKPLVLEDSGVDIVSYGGGDGSWFVMLNSRSITKSRFEKKN